jgi:hypothetical protein
MLANRKAAYLWPLSAAAVLFALHWYDINYPTYCDATGYEIIALGIKKVGLFGPWPLSEVRPYDNITPTTPNVAVGQSALYIAACLALFLVVYPTSLAARGAGKSVVDQSRSAEVTE